MNKIAMTVALLLATTTTTTAQVFAADEVNVVPGLTKLGAPLGLHGVDPVAFIDLGTRLDGTATYAAKHDGVTYYFSSEANKKAFEKSPARYVPQYGGFCTFGVSVGKKFDGDPRYAVVREGKLYVFLAEDIMQAFLKDPEGALKKAKKNWGDIEHTAARDL